MTPDELKKRLANVHHQSVKANRADRNIMGAARTRRDQVGERLAELRGEAQTDEAASAEYQDLLKERARLDLVLREG